MVFLSHLRVSLCSHTSQCHTLKTTTTPYILLDAATSGFLYYFGPLNETPSCCKSPKLSCTQGPRVLKAETAHALLVPRALFTFRHCPCLPNRQRRAVEPLTDQVCPHSNMTHPSPVVSYVILAPASRRLTSV